MTYCHPGHICHSDCSELPDVDPAKRPRSLYSVNSLLTKYPQHRRFVLLKSKQKAGVMATSLISFELSQPFLAMICKGANADPPYECAHQANSWRLLSSTAYLVLNL